MTARPLANAHRRLHCGRERGEITRFLGKQIRRSRPLLGCGLTFGRVVPLLSFIRTVCMYLVLRSMYDPTLERYTTRDYPGGVIVWYVGAKSLVGDRSVTKPQVRGLKFGTSRYSCTHATVSGLLLYALWLGQGLC